jgi:Lrp/AsnC family transcriptional regulator, leucine-responsive regulatory protein
MIDAIDCQIVSILQDDARTSNAEIARQLGMAPSAILERIRKLEARGVIMGYAARVNPRALDLGLLAFVSVRADEHVGATSTGDLLAALPEVQEVHHITGDDCYLVKVRVATTEALGLLLRERFGAIPTIRSTHSTIVLATMKESAALPIREVEEGSL